ncbi:MAG TPA: tRNA lysidine(34) synthetase TilS [Candidatus Saccharimonadales bacterium]|nr:tRNA lysidine(34) synthetase TilS [Candidatus Saccharimonadales bacterium]
METDVKPGKYVLAVSGGVDSVVLFDILRHQPGVQLVVAHFDHGIRPDSGADRLLVQRLAWRYGLPFVFARGNLGPDASEATARAARYAFLHQAREEHGADAVVTAHHQDDAIETALLNMLRGTGPRGLSALRSTDTVVRPLLHIPKQQLRDYAEAHGLSWREDGTNQDDRYRRNYLRQHVTPRLTPAKRRKLLRHIAKAHRLDEKLGRLLEPYVATPELDRGWFIRLPHAVSSEVMALWLRRHNLGTDRAGIQRLVVFAKTARPGKQADVSATHTLAAGKNNITLAQRAALR